MELALRRWGEATQSRGELLLVAGESGIGKTRLLSELVTRSGVARSPKAGAFPRETDAPGAILLNLATIFIGTAISNMHARSVSGSSRRVAAPVIRPANGAFC